MVRPVPSSAEALDEANREALADVVAIVLRVNVRPERTKAFGREVLVSAVASDGAERRLHVKQIDALSFGRFDPVGLRLTLRDGTIVEF
jgi:hypothetical protein